MYKIFLFLFIPYVIAFTQPFQISEVPTEEYSIDRFENTIYYLDRYNWDVYQTDLDNGITKKSKIPFIPSFANKSHKAVYSLGSLDRNIYLYDFDLDTSYVLVNRTSTDMNKQSSFYSSLYMFSPDDSKLLIRDSPNSAYFSFKDSTIYDMEIDLYNRGIVEWSSDSTIIYNGHDDYVIMGYNLNEKREDTLLVINQEYTIITSFSFSISSQELAYSIRGYPPSFIPQIYLLNIYTKENRIIFDPPIDDPGSYAVCWSSPVTLTSLKWSTNQKELGFFSTIGTYSGSGIFIYSKDSSRTFRYTLCDDYGLKYDMEWFNKDTIIYFNSTEKHIFGFNVSKKIVGITEKEYEYSFNLNQNFPNPFNPTTTISYTLPHQSSVESIIYDIMGREIKSFMNISQNAGTYNIVWDGTNTRGENISSGVYLYRIKVTSLVNNEVFEKSSKLMLMK